MADDAGAEADEAEDEPLVKYQRLGADVPALASMPPPDAPPAATPPPDQARHGSLTRVCVSPKSIAIGTSHGSVHLLDLAGNEVRRWQQHSGAVSDLSFDRRGEYLASASEDGTCVVQSLLSDDERESHWHDRPLRCVALDPTFAKRRSRRVCCGGLGAQLVISSKGWLGQRDHVLHAGEGPITACRWAGDAVAWCNDRGMKVYDVEAQHRVTFVPKPAAVARASDPTLAFHANGDVLLLAWGPTVKVLRLRDPGAQAAAVQTTAAQPAQPKLRYAEVTASLDLEASCHVASAAPIGDWLLCLCRPWREPGAATAASTDGGGGGGDDDDDDDDAHGQPEVRVFDWRGNETVAPDGLPLRGFEAAFPPSSVSGPGVLQLGWWHPDVPAGADCNGGTVTASPGEGHNFALWWGSASGEEPLFYLLSCADVVLARPRTADDHAQWLLTTHPDAEAAARFALSSRRSAASGGAVGPLALGGIVSAETYGKCVEERLTYLTVRCDPPRWPEAAACCARYLDPMDTTAWEKWVFEFAHHRQLAALAEYLPVPQAGRGSGGAPPVPSATSPGSPRLSADCYEMTLGALVAWPLDAADNATRYLVLSRGAAVLLRLFRRWPTYLFNAEKVAASAAATLARVEADAGAINKDAADGMAIGAWPEFDQPMDENPSTDAWAGTDGSEGERSLRLEAARLLREGLAELSLLSGKRAEALAHYLQLRRPGVFEFVERHGMHGLALAGNVRALYACESAAMASATVSESAVDAHRPRADARGSNEKAVGSAAPESISAASAMLASDEGTAAVAPAVVGTELVGADLFASLRDAGTRPAVPDTKGARCLLAYLDHLALFQPSLAGKLATAHVRLASALAPHRLLALLRSSQSYPLEVALAECRARGQHAESIYLLERMGLHREAMDVLVNDLNDVAGAARLATSPDVADASLWEDLVARACENPHLAGELLECLATSTSTDAAPASSAAAAGGGGGQHVSNAPAAARNLLRKLPSAMPVPQLRDRLRRCVEGVRTELSLHAGCAAIMRSDVSVLFARKLKLARRGVPTRLLPSAAPSGVGGV